MAHSFSFIDFFSGIGGFRIPLERLNGHSVGYSEIDKQSIAVYEKNFDVSEENAFGDITLSSCGWDTVTTKSRLNAVLDTFLHGFHVWQRNFTWYIGNTGNCGAYKNADVFFDGYTISR